MIYTADKALFWSSSLSELLSAHEAKAKRMINDETPDYLLNVNEDEYRQHVFDEYSLEPIRIDKSGIVISEKGEAEVPSHVSEAVDAPKDGIPPRDFSHFVNDGVEKLFERFLVVASINQQGSH